MKDRIKNTEFLEKVVSPEEAVEFIKNGMNIVTSGFTPAGYPKAIPKALAEKMTNSNDENFKINLFTGASVGDELDGELARAGVINKRSPYQTNKSMRNAINNGEVLFNDLHLSHVAQQVRYGFYGKPDIAIVEATEITEEGHIIPSTSVGNSPTFIQEADKVIIEINTSQPLELKGMHDIYIPQDPPNRAPIPISRPDERIGKEYIPVDSEKVICIVVTDIRDDARPLAPIDEVSEKMAGNLIKFLENEISQGRLPQEMLPLQSGVGGVANAVLGGLVNSNFKNLDFYSEVIQDSVLDLIDAGKIRIASGTSITLSDEGLNRFYNDLDKYKDRIILRPQEISNNPEVIRRLGSIAMNTAIEADIYGNVNSTHVMGSRMMNGIGGSGDFSRNGYLTIFTTASIAKGGDISSIVPMVSHVDHTEHDIDVIVTEQGAADIRGLSPRERTQEIIEKCAHPDFKPYLEEYYRKALETTGKHTPHKLDEALSWHVDFLEKGTMK